MAKVVRLGLIGLGTVGGGLVELISRSADTIEAKSGVRLEVARALVRRRGVERPVGDEKLCYEITELLDDPTIDIVVEVMGGIEPAKDYILCALKSGKDVVTANKAVLATHGAEIFDQATRAGRQLGFEASVCGGIPIIRALSSGLIANDIDELVGILNGTSNFVLSRMKQDRLPYDEAVRLAQERGLAEADPTYDVAGLDAAHKLIVLAELTFQTKARVEEIEREGIEQITPLDIEVADRFGFVIKPVAVARRHGELLDLRVHPALVPFLHPLGPVSDEYNAVLVKGDAVGEMVFLGKGAGSLPTASAVLSDIVEIARNPGAGVMWNPLASRRLAHIEGRSRYYLRLPIHDRPGLIGVIGTVLGNHGISITHAQAVLSGGDAEGNVMVITHETSETEVCQALDEIRGAGVLRGEPVSLRILE
ncbi:MAG: homoserine dehydrogenase [Fimbriimonadaceae bacterium]|nr:homoserine dehydrogenase [Fimbriimonadaceae bacterium]QYK54772.1 MAG: homoserine dehydrogenase [Fimbriimonadaceae bacterium]